jgi:predicted regulator of Ras-like GTPase activity (Roadblock/LC7/MglB family)
MSTQGNLQDISVADLIQQNCQARKTARLTLRAHNEEATLFFAAGQVTHATLGDMQGEEVVYRVLNWTEGRFELEPGIVAPRTTIQRTWSGLLLEGARRLDEGQLAQETGASLRQTHTEVKAMELDNVLKELGDQVNGFIATAVVGMDGIGLSQFSKSKKVDVENVNAQTTLLVKLIETSVDKLGAGVIEDILLTTEDAYLLVRFLKDRGFYLGIVADRKSGQVGNMRLISKLFAERIAKVMPR